MALKKGFLKPKNIINKYRISTGIILGTAYSFGLYGFFYHLREAFRIFTSEYGGNILIELTPTENFFYNFFYALIASVFGFYIFIKFVGENSMNNKNKKIRFKIRTILNNQAFSSWNFLYLIFRLASFFGILYITIPIQFDIDFYNEYQFLMLLLPLVFFLNNWPNIFMIFGGKAYKWFLYSLIYILLLSLLMANINFLNYKKINKNLKNQNVELAYSLNVPVSEHFQRLTWRKRIIAHVYVLDDSLKKNQSIIFWNDKNNEIKINKIGSFISRWRNTFHELERYRLSINLHIDEEIPLIIVNNIKQELRKKNIQRIVYSTRLKHSKYPSYYPLFKNMGIAPLFYYPFYYPKFEAFLDSAESLDYSKFRLRIPESLMYRNRAIKGIDRVVVRVTKKNLLLNEVEISSEDLQVFIQKFIMKYASNGVIIYEPDDDIKFKRYIEYLDLLYTIVDKLRNEMSYRLFNESFNSWDSKDPNDKDKINLVREKFPRQIIEWTDEEKRLNALMKKQNKL